MAGKRAAWSDLPLDDRGHLLDWIRKRLAAIRSWWHASDLQERLEVFVLAAAVVSAPIVVLEELGSDTPVLLVADWLVWFVFAGEYLVLLAASRDRIRYVRRRWLWLAVVVLSFPAFPALLGLIRLVRLGRLVRLIAVGWRGLDALQSVLGRRGLVRVAAMTGAIVIAGGGLMAELEPWTVRGGFWAGVWWARPIGCPHVRRSGAATSDNAGNVSWRWMRAN